MITNLQTRADARALFSAALAGAAVGLVLGGCYLAGGLANAAARHKTVTRVADAAGGAYSDVALISAPGADTGALAVMRRRDPSLPAADLEQGRQIATLDDRLQRSGPANARFLLRTTFGGVYNPAAAPFRAAGALEGPRELECLTQAVYYEARGEGPSGQAAVAQVVLNRVRHPAFPKSVCAVVFQRANGRGCQFSFACDGSLNGAHERLAWSRAQRIASRALAGAVMADVGNATHFHTTAVAPQWGPHLLRVAQVGLHVFYRFGGRAGAPDAFDRTPTPSDSMDMMVASAGDVSATALAAMAQSVTPMAIGGMGGPANAPSEPASAPADKAETTKSQPVNATTVATAKTAAAS